MAADLERLCRERGLKFTMPRRVVLEVLEESTDHPTATDIQRRAERQHPICSGTIYRVLNRLTEAGLVTRHLLRDGKAHYERGAREPHLHLIDLKSGAIVELAAEGLWQLLEAEALRQGYRLLDYRLKMYGTTEC